MRRPPILDWLPHYDRRDLRSDLIAGLLGTISTVPEAMAFAILAGLPAQMGLYSLLLPVLAYVILGTSRELSLSPTAQIVALVSVAVAPLAAGDPARFAGATVTMTWAIGAILFLAGVLRLGFLASLVSRPVLSGYFGGAALLIAAAQLCAMAGLDAHGLSLPDIVHAAVSSRGKLQLSSLALGLFLLALLYGVRALGLKAASAAVVVVAGMAIVALSHLDVAVVGTIPAGLPPITLPSPATGGGGRLLLGAFAGATLVFFDSTAVARRLAAGKGYSLDADQEQRALGIANLAAGLTGAAPVSGNLADTLLLEEARARTPMTGIVTVVLVGLLVLLGADLGNVPLAAFAAIVIHAVLRMPMSLDVRRAWRFDRTEVLLGFTALAGVVGLGLMRGLFLAVALTLLVLLERISRMEIRETEQRGSLVFQPMGSLFFASAPAFAEHVRVRAFASRTPVPVIVDLRTAPYVDLTACDALEKLQQSLAIHGSLMHVVGASPTVETRLRRYGLEELLQPPPA